MDLINDQHNMIKLLQESFIIIIENGLEALGRHEDYRLQGSLQMIFDLRFLGAIMAACNAVSGPMQERVLASLKLRLEEFSNRVRLYTRTFSPS